MRSFPEVPSTRLSGLCLSLVILAAALPATAQTTAPPKQPMPAPDRCLALARNHDPAAPILHRARFELASLKPYQVRLTYHGHSTFTIESPKGIVADGDAGFVVVSHGERALFRLGRDGTVETITRATQEVPDLLAVTVAVRSEVVAWALEPARARRAA